MACLIHSTERLEVVIERVSQRRSTLRRTDRKRTEKKDKLREAKISAQTALMNIIEKLFTDFTETKRKTKQIHYPDLFNEETCLKRQLVSLNDLLLEKLHNNRMSTK